MTDDTTPTDDDTLTFSLDVEVSRDYVERIGLDAYADTLRDEARDNLAATLDAADE